jgi:hypothetical protein
MSKVVAGNAAIAKRSVADPIAEYMSMLPLWKRTRAVIGGESTAKAHDETVSIKRNLLIPFSIRMTPLQYELYLQEAELPGVTREFAAMIVGGLLRKVPTIDLPEMSEEDAAEVKTWLVKDFGIDGKSLINALDDWLNEELATSRAWVYVDHQEEALEGEGKPYPVLWRGEDVINWRIEKHKLVMVVTSRYIESWDPAQGAEEFHPQQIREVRVHELVNSTYQIRVFHEAAVSSQATVVDGVLQAPTTESGAPSISPIGAPIVPLVQGAPLDFIPAWPLNGSIECSRPVLQSFVDKEVALYNKISRRNHLMYGAATYTPYLVGDIDEPDFARIVGSGLGSWLNLPAGTLIGVLEPPTASLEEMNVAIEKGFEELAKLGIRMLAPDNAASGVSLDLRNASQNARISSLSAKVSATVAQIIKFMIRWRYGTDVNVSFVLSEDFAPAPQTADWAAMATEWYQAGLIPRSAWLSILQRNDMLPADYDDGAGQEEISKEAGDVALRNEDKSLANNLLNQS